jgi:hypothetical protein
MAQMPPRPANRVRARRRLLLLAGLAGLATAGCQPVWVAPGWVSPSGSDSSSCSSRAPCRTLARAYSKGHDFITMKPGTYPGQTLPSVVGHRKAFVLGKGVKLADTTALDVRADNVQVQGLDLDGQTYVEGANGLRFQNVDFGPAVDRNPLMVSGGVRSGPLEVVDSKLHDAKVTSPSVHQECAWLGWIDGLKITGSDFRGCTYFDIFLTQFIGQPARNVQITGNTLCSTVQWNGQPAIYSVMVANHITNAVNYRITNNRLGMPVANDPQRATNVVVGSNTKANC